MDQPAFGGGNCIASLTLRRLISIRGGHNARYSLRSGPATTYAFYSCLAGESGTQGRERPVSLDFTQTKTDWAAYQAKVDESR